MAMGSRITLAAGASLIIAMACADALAQEAPDAAAGREAYLAADFPAAAAAFERALDADARSREDALEAHRHLAMLRFVLGDADAARGHTAAALTLERDAQPPEGSPPEVTGLFDEARARLGRRSALELEVEPREEGATLVASLALWPSALSGSLSVECATDGGAPLRAQGRPPRVSLAVPSLALDTRCGAALGPRTGAVWLTATRQLAAETRPPARGDDEVWPWVLGGVGAALVVAAIIVVAVVLAPGGAQDARFAPVVQVPGW